MRGYSVVIWIGRLMPSIDQRRHVPVHQWRTLASEASWRFFQQNFCWNADGIKGGKNVSRKSRHYVGKCFRSCMAENLSFRQSDDCRHDQCAGELRIPTGRSGFNASGRCNDMSHVPCYRMMKTVWAVLLNLPGSHFFSFIVFSILLRWSSDNGMVLDYSNGWRLAFLKKS